nr:immunoglobulin heavy chain junction region [Mus musculus]
YIFLCKRLRR